MPRDGAIIFSDLIGKLEVLRVTCEKCGRDGRYIVARLIRNRGRDAKLIDWLDELTTECPKKIVRGAGIWRGFCSAVQHRRFILILLESFRCFWEENNGIGDKKMPHIECGQPCEERPPCPFIPTASSQRLLAHVW